MFGSRLFRSRWTALIWAGGVIWTACDVASSTPAKPAPAAPSAAAPQPAASATPAPVQTDATGEPVTQADLSILAHTVVN